MVLIQTCIPYNPVEHTHFLFCDRSNILKDMAGRQFPTQQSVTVKLFIFFFKQGLCQDSEAATINELTDQS